jgi:hypothetical protein
MAKYDSLRKPEKKRLIREYRAAHPELSYKEVGDMFGVDAAWAWRICKEVLRMTMGMLKLRDPRWQKKRLEILSRDEWMCQSCFDSESTLVVHRRRYLAGRDPWDYPDSLLITLCEECQKRERDEMPASDDDLLAMLHEKFLSPAINDLAHGFHALDLQHQPEVVASVYSWALSVPNIQRELIDRYFEHLKHKAEQRKRANAQSHS